METQESTTKTGKLNALWVSLAALLTTAVGSLLFMGTGVQAAIGDGVVDADDIVDLTDVVAEVQDNGFEFFGTFFTIFITLLPLFVAISLVFYLVRKIVRRLTGNTRASM